MQDHVEALEEGNRVEESSMHLRGDLAGRTVARYWRGTPPGILPCPPWFEVEFGREVYRLTTGAACTLAAQLTHRRRRSRSPG